MTKQINVCFIINNLGQGGAERQFVQLLRHIDKQKFNVTLCLYAADKGVFYRDVFDILDVTIIQNTLKSKTAALKIIEALFYIYRILKKNQFDIVQTTLFMNGLFVRLVAPRRYTDRIVTNIRTSLKLYTKYHLFAEKLLIIKSYVVANSKKATEELIGRVPIGERGRVRHIYNGYDTEVFQPRQIDKSCNTIDLGCVGRIYHIKNYLQVVRVVHSLNNSAVRLLVIGESGDQEEDIRCYIRQNGLEKQILIMPKQTKIEEFYNRFDILIISSLLEGCPNVLFEAMLSKCFCIISENANSDQFVVHGENGLVYDGTDEDLKKKLEYAISILGSDCSERLKVNGYQYALYSFSMESMVKSYENLYREILNGTITKN